VLGHPYTSLALLEYVHIVGAIYHGAYMTTMGCLTGAEQERIYREVREGPGTVLLPLSNMTLNPIEAQRSGEG
jgi:hypothetical protein